MYTVALSYEGRWVSAAQLSRIHPHKVTS